MRALLIPERKLSGELRVLIDARFDLQRAINQTRLGKVVNQQRPVRLAITTARHPADHVISLCGSKRKDLDKFNSRFLSG